MVFRVGEECVRQGKEMKKKSKRYHLAGGKESKIVRENTSDYFSKPSEILVAPHYASFEISNFRCFPKLQIAPLSMVNLITGMNNVGKTAFLEALFLHIGATNPSLALRINLWRGLGTFTELAGMLWQTLFWQLDDTKSIKLVAKNKKGQQRSLTIRVSPSPSALLEEVPAKVGAEFLKEYGQDLLLEYVDEFKKIHKIRGTPEIIKKGDLIQFQLRSEPLITKIPFPGIFINSWRQGLAEEEIQRFSDLRIKNQDKFVVKALQGIEPRLEQFEILSPHGVSMIHGHLKGYSEPVPLPLLGDGVRRVTSLVLSIGAARGGTVLVDEIENGIHHSVMSSLWDVIADAAHLFGTQIFATTHSQECVYAAHEAFKSREVYDFKLHRLERTNDEVIAKTYDEESLEGALSIPLEVRG